MLYPFNVWKKIMEYYDSSINTIFGSSELQVYVTDPLQKQIETVY
jgi:hypothetical protein